jgi:hypothetical protein
VAKAPTMEVFNTRTKETEFVSYLSHPCVPFRSIFVYTFLCVCVCVCAFVHSMEVYSGSGPRDAHSVTLRCDILHWCALLAFKS